MEHGLSEALSRLVSVAEEHGASDIFLLVGQQPRLRIGGGIVPVETEPVAAEMIESLRVLLCGREGNFGGDGATVSQSGTRLRLNVYRELGQPAAVIRILQSKPPTLRELGVPVELLESWLGAQSGLILVSGRTGAGKSTTLAACLEWLNHQRPLHVVTVEDPVEYVFTAEQCLFSQREVGLDVADFPSGVREALRQSPDVILIGEIRDGTTAQAALRAAETGHLVLATVHGGSAREALERFAILTAEAEREWVLRLTSQLLYGMINQLLLPSGSGDGLVLACEYFQNEGMIRSVIAERRWGELADALTHGSVAHSQTMTQSIASLALSGQITESVALSVAPKPTELQRMLRGIQTGSDSSRRS